MLTGQLPLFAPVHWDVIKELQRNSTNNSVARIVVRWAGVFIVLLGSTVIPARSQDTVNEAWPEIDTYVTLSPTYRLSFAAAKAADRDSGQERWQFGPNLDITLKPILRMKFRTLDPEKRKYLTFRVGYRHLISQPGDENRMIMEVTPRVPLPKSFLLTDRNRMDLRWRDGFSWRYRNRLGVEKEFQDWFLCVLSIRAK